MIKLSLTDIRNTTTETVFKRGAKYYQQKLVHALTVHPDCIIAQVEGSDLYEVVITFHDNTGEITHYECNCPAYYKYTGACKHIVAVLLEILYKKEKLAVDLEKKGQREVIQLFIDKYLYTPKSTHNTPINISVDFVITLNGVGTNLRMGLNQLYIVKDFKELYKAIKGKKTTIIGKQFTFDGSLHRFDGINQEIISLFIDYFETFQAIKGFNYLADGLYVNNAIFLPDNYLKRLLTILENKSFHIRHQSMTYYVTISNQLEMKFEAYERHMSIIIKLLIYSQLLPFTHDKEYVFYDGMLYHLDDEQQQYYDLIVSTFDKESSLIKLDMSDKHHFISAIVPILETYGEVKVDKSLTTNLYDKKFSAEIYIDRLDDTIKGTLSFIYGDYKIGAIPKDYSMIPNDITLKRDLKKEAKIMALLEKANCIIDDSKEYFTILKGDTLFEFIYDYLPLLQLEANVYYTDAFKNLHIDNQHLFTSSIRLSTDLDLLEFSFGLENIEQKELSDILQMIKEKKKYYKLKDGSFLPLDRGSAITINELMSDLSLTTKDLKKGLITLPKYRALYIDNLLMEKGLDNITTNHEFSQLIKDVKNPESIDFPLPITLKNILRDYQKYGYKWLKTLSHYGFGGILADDMGLGKTIQAIALVKASSKQLPSIVIAPTSLIYNWEDEIYKFAPDMKALVLTGNKAIRIKAFKNINDYHLIITSYGILKRDIDELNNYKFEYCFLDEAQHIKNPKSLNAKSVKMINASTKFALTGTPIENSLSELWSIFDFIMPGYLHSHHKFSEKYEKPIIKSDDQKALHELTSHIKPFILRRLKNDVLKELPPKIESKMSIELLTKQKKIYLAYMSKIKSEVKNEISSKGYNKSAIKILAALTRLRQICCHPDLFIENYHGGSAKLDLLEELVLDAIMSDHRILIFSQFTSMLKIIEGMLIENKITSFYLDGQTKAEMRRDMVNAFNDGEKNCFLISLKAGGTGLNLTGADMVIHYDPWWNPAVEDQATDRAYRIGQDKPVQVIKLITAGTIEEKIYALQQKKKALTDVVIQPGETFINKLTKEEILDLFEIE